MYNNGFINPALALLGYNWGMGDAPPPPAPAYRGGGGGNLPVPQQQYQQQVAQQVAQSGVASGNPFLTALVQNKLRQQLQQNQLAEFQQQIQMQQQMANLIASGIAPDVPGMQGLRPCRVAAKTAGTPVNARQPLPFDSVSTVAAGATATITTRPQVRYQPDKLVIAAPSSWLIQDIKIGVRSQFGANGALPGELFANDTTDSGLVFESADVSQDITLIVVNNTAGALRFVGAMLGDACG